MKYNISYFSDDGYKELKEISSDEFKKLYNYRKFIIFYYSFEQLFDFIKNNIYEFWKFYFEVLEKYRLKIILYDEEIQESSAFFNIKLANILSSLRSYEDHLKNKISVLEIDSEAALKYYKEKCSIIYDNYFSFRFFYRLRNYIQHFDLPITKVSYNSKLIDEDIQYSLKLLLSKTALMRYNGWSKLKDEITVMDKEIDVKVYLNDFLYSLSSLHEYMRIYYLDYFWNAEIILNSIKDECIENNFVNYKKKPNTFEVIDICKVDEVTNNKERYWLPIQRLTDIRKYFQKSDFNKNIINSFSTNKNTV